MAFKAYLSNFLNIDLVSRLEPVHYFEMNVPDSQIHGLPSASLHALQSQSSYVYLATFRNPFWKVKALAKNWTKRPWPVFRSLLLQPLAKKSVSFTAKIPSQIFQ